MARDKVAHPVNKGSTGGAVKHTGTMRAVEGPRKTVLNAWNPRKKK